MNHGSDLILVGKIAGTHGIKGQLKAASFSGEWETFLSLKSVMLKSAAGAMEAFTVSATAVHGKKVLLSLKGLNDINQVEQLIGREIYIRREQLPPLDDDEYYWCELQGMAVVTEQGERLGKLTGLISTGSNDVYAVTADDGREYLIPAVEGIVVSVDTATGVMTVSPPEGLLDL